MLRIALFILTISAFVSLSSAAPSTDTPTAPQVRAALDKALPFLEQKCVAWLDKQKCIACHHGAWTVWGLNEAKHAGLTVDPKTFDALSARVAAMYMKDVPNYQKKKNGWVESTYMLLSRDYGPAADKDSAEVDKAAHVVMLAGQRADGSWKYAGQGLERPDVDNDEATTLWALLALPHASKGDTSNTAVRESALAWLKKMKPGPGLDSLALRLAVETRFGDPARAAELKDELIARQNPNGGWKWSEKRPSDAFATGESLYVLALAGVKSDDPAISRAWKFLVATQRPDGSWLCDTRKPKGGREISTFWGTSWAVIGLSRSLPVNSAGQAAVAQ
jgi:squalene cyclase